MHDKEIVSSVAPRKKSVSPSLLPIRSRSQFQSMKTNPIRQSIISAALVAAVSFSVWYGLNRNGVQTVAPLSETDAPKPAAPVADATLEPGDLVSTEDLETAPSLAGARKKILPRLTNVVGQPLDLNSAAYLNSGRTGEKVHGRTADVDTKTLASLADVQEGDVVSIPTFDGELHGVVEVAINEDNGARRVGGPIEGDRSKGWFSFGYDGEHATGLVRLNAEKLAYRIESAAVGRYQLVERPLADLMCLSLPSFAAARVTAARTAAAAAPPVVTPILNSRPAANAQLLMDFDGDNVNDPDWGRINAPASPLSAAQRADVFRRVRDDFLQFNINVTTDQAKYNAAPVGDRMRCIVTTVDTAAPGAGGVAYLNSFAYAGTIFSNNIPCWCFNPTVKSIADTISHEAGHTFGLNHDGLVGRAEYYFGQGTGPTSWGPIMGAPFTRSVTQWSKGEYAGANRYEFDIEIIANKVNGFGYAPDDAGDTIATAAPLSVTGSTIDQRGVIDKLGDSDVFYFNTRRGGGLLVSASGIGNQVGNCDVELEVINKNGVVLGTNTFDRSLGAGLNVVVPAGTNYIRIRGAGDGNVDTTGYSSYGSVGAYTMTGLLPF